MIIAVIALVLSASSLLFTLFCMKYETPADAREAFRRLRHPWR